MKSEKCYNYLDYVLPLYFIVALPEMYFGMWGISVVVKYFAFFLILLLFPTVFRQNNIINSRGIGLIFTSFFLYVICSVVLYGINGINIRCYTRELYNTIPAMFFFYVGVSEKRTNNRFYKWFMYSCSISMVIGIFLYVTVPGWFLTRRTEYENMLSFSEYQKSEDNVISALRFSSYLGDSYEVDMFALFALSISLFVFFYNYKRSLNTKIPLVCIFINFLAAILCQQRSAMAYCVLAIAVFLLIGIKYRNAKASINLLTIISISIASIVAIAFLYVGDRAADLQLLLEDRVDNMTNKSIFERYDYMLKLLTDHWEMPIFGHGIGAGGAVAGALGYPHVTDCSYIELLYELGIVGFSILALILIQTVRRGIKYIRIYATELVFIGFVLTAMLGSNTLDIDFMTTFPFWYSIGRIWNRSFFDYAINKKISI